MPKNSKQSNWKSIERMLEEVMERRVAKSRRKSPAPLADSTGSAAATSKSNGRAK